MNSCIYIDGLALWILLALLVGILFCIVYIGCSLTEKMRENEQLRHENKTLRYKLSKAEDKLYKATYKTPEVD